MTLTKLEDLKPYGAPACNHAEHNPPTHMLMEAGTYQWKCPGCMNVVQFTVTKPTAHSSKVIVGNNR